MDRVAPGKVRDAIVGVLANSAAPVSLIEIELAVSQELGQVPSSSVRSYLNNNTPDVFERTARGFYKLKQPSIKGSAGESKGFDFFKSGLAQMYCGDCTDWLATQPEKSIEAVLTDPPYGLVEFEEEQLRKKANGSGGVWRVPPSFDGTKRSPLPRFTVLNADEKVRLTDFFVTFARALFPVLVPGANVLVASNPLLCHLVASALSSGGLEYRGMIVRLVMTMRGGDRPKNAHAEFPDVSVMPRSMWEPWIVLRRPLEGRVQDNLRRWRTGGFRRISESQPFGDVIQSGPTNKKERALAPHPSLKPQRFLRQVVRSVLPAEEGRILDPFAGSGSTLAAANALGFHSIGIEKNKRFFELSRDSIPKLASI